MFHYGVCPRCESSLDTSKVYGSIIVCDCGWSRSMRQSSREKRSMDRTSAGLILIGGLLIASFIHAINWDTYFFAVIPLKARIIAGSATPVDLERMAEICNARKRIACVESSLVRLTKLDPSNLNNVARLGNLQLRREEWAAADKTFRHYFKSKGTSPDAAYDFAQVLTQQKKYREASNYFRFALRAKPRTFQITVARSYILMLIDANRLKEAKSEILNNRRRSSAANMFMHKELQDIRMRLGEIRKTASAGV